jgi:hypothetical protein
VPVLSWCASNAIVTKDAARLGVDHGLVAVAQPGEISFD